MNSKKQPRKVPEWMKKKGGRKQVVYKAVDKIKTKQKVFDENTDFNSSLELANEKFESSNNPMATYDGKINYYTDYYDIAEAMDNLITKVDKMSLNLKENEKIPVAFDLEWSFNYLTGPEKTAVIQICVDFDECYVLQISQLKKFPASIGVFLNHPAIILHGVNIKNDLRKLERDISTLKAEPLIAKCVELGQFYNEVFSSSERWSLERLCLQTLKLRLDKNRNIRMSKWNYAPLSEQQLLYASLDVYVSCPDYI
jgi:predicted GNAT family acetyltransferase